MLLTCDKEFFASCRAHLRKYPNLLCAERVAASTRCAFANDDARRHSVAACHPGHDGSVGDAQIFNAVDLQVTVHDGQRVLVPFWQCRSDATS